MSLKKVERKQQWLFAGKIVRGLRKARGLTQLELAEQCGYLRQNISAIERGQRGIPDEALPQIAKALKVPETSLIMPTVLDKAEFQDFTARRLEELLFSKIGG
jgi:transcriptional regulator with XRE-family HTH domain